MTDWKNDNQVKLFIKRDDQLHTVISGNKWRKLKYNLEQAIEQDTSNIISFGGGYSNHLHALAYCCYKLKIKFTAIVRGDYSASPTPMLTDINRWNANIHYVDRKTYKLRSDKTYLAELQNTWPNAYIIPEGGSNVLALKGTAEIIDETFNHYDHILCPVGSGGTLAGLISAQSNAQITGIAVLKGTGYLEDEVSSLLKGTAFGSQWSIDHNHHFGGYAKAPAELREFCEIFERQTGIAIEPVYSGKLFFALKHLVENNYFEKGSRILAIHTGGLQGSR